MTQPEARAVIEGLRYGIPPKGHTTEFTVGRESQLRQLAATLGHPTVGHGSALLVRANYGAGKSHLLRVVQEKALEANHAVALVVCDAQNGVRFNRMDTMFGAITRELTVPSSGAAGLGALFDAFRDAYVTAKGDQTLQQELSRSGRWSPGGPLSDPVLIGLRAWILGTKPHHDLVSEWFAWPEAYRNRRKDLYWSLVDDLESGFGDPRSEARYYADRAFAFHTDGHAHAWHALRDLDAIARASGLAGVVLLIDEFEDVIQNLNNRNYQVAAFQNLFTFFRGDSHRGMAYFAVTPEFADRCREELMSRGVYDFPVHEFAKLPAFELDQITFDDFKRLSVRVAEAHSIAFGWPLDGLVGTSAWNRDVRSAWGDPSPNRIRRSIQSLVDTLDQFRSSRGTIA